MRIICETWPKPIVSVSFDYSLDSIGINVSAVRAALFLVVKYLYTALALSAVGQTNTIVVVM